MLEHEAPYAPDELVAVHTRRGDRTAHDDLDVARGHPPGASRQDLVAVTHDHGDDRDSGVERHHEAALLEPQKRVAGRGTGTLGEDHDRDALAHPQLGRTQAVRSLMMWPERLSAQPNTGARVSSTLATQRSWYSGSAAITARTSNWLRWFDMKT